MLETKHRTEAPEIMDDFALEGEELRDALDKIAQINQFLGGNKLTLHGTAKILEGVSREKEITIVDVGCGNGDMLRKLAVFGIKNNWKFKLIGVDANPFTIDYARNLSLEYPNISYRCENIFSEVFQQLTYDVLLCTLTLHHFKNNEIAHILSVFEKNSKIGIIINDLERSHTAYRLFQAVCFFFRLNRMSREDGLISILRGFKKEELIDFSEKLNLKKYTIQWKWAFRYQWIIQKI